MKADEAMRAIGDGIRAYCDETFDFAFDPENPVVRLHEPTFGAEEIEAAVGVLLSTFVTQGKRVRAFEAEFAASHGAAKAVMNNSGSSANLLAVAALANPDLPGGLRPGDEVIVSALSWSTTVWPLVQLGLVPVIVDIDPLTLDIDPGEIERAIGPRTRAVMVVHVYGNPCDMDAIADICARRDLILIEDCCEALGASYKNRPVGTIGRVGTYSFYFSHHITTLEGGICITDDAELADLMRILRAHGWVREVEDPKTYHARHPDIDPRFLFVNVGYNLRATELQAAMGAIQLPKLAGFVESRRAGGAFWTRELAQYAGLSLQRETAGGRHSWFGVPVTVKADAGYSAADLRAHLEAAHIETRPIICGNIAQQPAMAKVTHRVHGDLRHATHVMHNAFSWGNHQAVDAAARAYIAGVLAAFMQARG